MTAAIEIMNLRNRCSKRKILRIEEKNKRTQFETALFNDIKLSDKVVFIYDYL